MKLGELVLAGALVAAGPGCTGNVTTTASGTTGGGGSGSTGSASKSSTASTALASTSAASTSAASSAGGPGDGGVGDPCTGAPSCASGETCVTGVPGGYCSVVIAECSADPFAPGICPAGSWCVNGVQFGNDVGDFCMKICGGAADCRQSEGYACCPWGDAGVCSYGKACL